MVLVLHILGHGGVLDACLEGSINYHVSWLIEMEAYCAVNAFALITGYLMINRKWRVGRIIELWLQAIFYSLTITAIFFIAKPNWVGIKTWLQSLFPVCFKMWWYFTAYFALFFIIPFLNKLMDALTKRQTVILVGILIILFSIINTLVPGDIFILNNGYALAWLITLYILGGSIKKYNFAQNTKKRWFALLYIGSVVAVLISRFVLKYASNLILGRETYVNLLVNYTSPLVLLSAIALLLFFSRLQFSNKAKRIVKFISPLSFAVYLIQEHALFRKQFITGKFAYLASKNVFVLVGTIFAVAIVIFVACIILEWLRSFLFKKIKISKQAKKLGEYVDGKIAFYKEDK